MNERNRLMLAGALMLVGAFFALAALSLTISRIDEMGVPELIGMWILPAGLLFWGWRLRTPREEP